MSRLESIVSGVRELIESEALAPGDRLPPERELAELFRVSRNSVREAIRIMIEAGLLESRRGSGTYLMASSEDLALFDEDALQQKLGRSLARKRRRIRDVFAFRRIMEPGMAALAALNATPRDVERLKAIVYDQQRALENGISGEVRGYEDIDAAFHMELARASRNEVLQEVFLALAPLLAESRQREAQSPERRSLSPKGHFAIIQAIERGDPEACRKAMDEHLAEAERLALGVGPEREE